MADNERSQREGTKCLAGRGYDISGPFHTLLLPYTVSGAGGGSKKDGPNKTVLYILRMCMLV